MICYRDMTFCNDAKQCANAKNCFRNFDEEAALSAAKWWGGDDAPVAFGFFKSSCNEFKDTNNGND